MTGRSRFGPIEETSISQPSRWAVQLGFAHCYSYKLLGAGLLILPLRLIPSKQKPGFPKITEM